MKETPEDCILTAHWSGDGWAFCVERKDNESGDVVCYLAWPKQWPDKMSSKGLEKHGFEIV